MFFPCLMPHELKHLAKLIDIKIPDISEQDLRRSILTANLYHNVRMGLLQMKSSQRTKKALSTNNERKSSVNMSSVQSRRIAILVNATFDENSDKVEEKIQQWNLDDDTESQVRIGIMQRRNGQPVTGTFASPVAGKEEPVDKVPPIRPDQLEFLINVINEKACDISERTERGDLRRGVLTDQLKKRVRIGIRQAHRGHPITGIRTKRNKKRNLTKEGALPTSAESPKVKKSFTKNDVCEEEPPTKKKKYIHSSSSSKGSLSSDTLSSNHRLDSTTSHDNDHNRSGDFAVPNAHIITKTDGNAKKRRK